MGKPGSNQVQAGPEEARDSPGPGVFDWTRRLTAAAFNLESAVTAQEAADRADDSPRLPLWRHIYPSGSQTYASAFAPTCKDAAPQKRQRRCRRQKKNGPFPPESSWIM